MTKFALGAQFSVLKDAAIFCLCGAGGGERLVGAHHRRAQLARRIGETTVDDREDRDQHGQTHGIDMMGRRR